MRRRDNEKSSDRFRKQSNCYRKKKVSISAFIFRNKETKKHSMVARISKIMRFNKVSLNYGLLYWCLLRKYIGS